MRSNIRPNPPAEPPVWGFALFLSAVVLCLLCLVLRTLLFSPARRPAETTEGPPGQLSTEPPSSRRAIPFVYKVKQPAAPVSAPVVAPESPPEPPVSSIPPAVTGPPPWPRVTGAAFGGWFPSGPGGTNYRTAILGEVLLRGTPPAEQALDLTQDAYCARLQKKPLTTRFFVVGPQKGLADVLVFIRDGVPRRARLPSGQRQLGFTNCQIAPYVLVASTRDSLTVRNNDGTSHLLRMTPAQSRELRTQVDPGTTAQLLLPSLPELLIPCRCDAHPWESAWLSVLEHPFFAVTGHDGRFAITNIPPGSYVLEACHPQTHGTNGITQQITIRSGEVATARFVVETGE